jgi:phage gpG-like protein
MVTGFISYEVDNDNQFKNALNKAIKSVGDLRFPMGEISRDIFKNTKKNFILKGDGKYPPLSPKYKAFKQKKRPSAPILVFDGDLRDSVTGTGNQDTIRNIGKQSLVQGTKVPYAKFVQEGTEFMPARKFLFIDDAQIIRFKRILQDYVTAKLEVVGNVV